MARSTTLDRPKQLITPKRGVDGTLTKAPVAKGVRAYPHTNSAAECAMVDPDKPLTALQIEFVKYWASGESIPSACLRAGYADDGMGYRLARMPNIRRRYDAEKLKYEEAAQMSRKAVMDMFLESYQMAKLLSEPASMVSAAREIGRMCGYYEPIKVQVAHTHKGEVQVRTLNAMSDTELLNFLSGQSSMPAAIEHVEEVPSEG